MLTQTSSTPTRLARFGTLGILGSAVMIAAACEDSRSTVVKDLEWSTPTSSVLVTSTNGSITALRNDAVVGAKVRAEVTCRGSTIDEATRRAEGATLVVEPDAKGTLVVRVDFPAPQRGGDSAAFVVELPQSTTLDLRSTNGAISVTGFDGTVGARTSNGAITVKDHSGAMTLRSSNGRIGVSASKGAVDAETSNGRVEISLAEGSVADIRVETSNGAVSLDLPASWQGAVDASTSNGAIEITAPGADGQRTTTRTKGRSSVVVGDRAAATASIRTSNGAVSVKSAR